MIGGLDCVLISSCLMLTEMVDSMKRVACLDQELTVEERNLLSVAYKNVIGARRASWRIVSSIEQKEEGKGASSKKVKLLQEYRIQVSTDHPDSVRPSSYIWLVYPGLV